MSSGSWGDTYFYPMFFWIMETFNDTRNAYDLAFMSNELFEKHEQILCLCEKVLQAEQERIAGV